MANETTTLLQKVTVGATNVSSVIFSNISQSYTDLKLVVSARTSTSGDFRAYVYPNSATTNLSSMNIYGDGSTAYSNTYSNGAIGFFINTSDSGASIFGSGEIYFTNYTSSNHKSFSLDGVTEATASGPYMGISSGRWANTSAITSLEIKPTLGSFVQHSTFYLYGIVKQGVTPAATSTPYATGGDDITFDGTNWIHTFRSTGTFTPSRALSNVDFLVIGGGGGGYVQGGGAGGYRTSAGTSGANSSAESKLSLTAQAYTVTVGAGGTQGNSGVNGSDSSIAGSGFTTITSLGGGSTSSGGSNGLTGGSGSGAFNSGTAGSGTANQGFAGGAAPTSSAGGGGGGASSAGSAASGSTGGSGGNGLSSSITGSAVTRAGGGAGYGTGSSGTAGTGGGGTAGAASPTSDGGANTGSGGGGNNAGNGGKGGAGIVVIRYAA